MTTSSFAIAHHLQQLGVQFVFGMPGGASLPFLDALRQVGIEFILVRHEGSAGFMADAVFQRTGKLGVCLATLGPGATNLVSGIAQSFTERTKVLGIVSQIDSQLYSIYTHQIIDQQRIFSAICHHYISLHPHRVHDQLRKLFRAIGESNGPIVLELTKSVATTETKLLATPTRPTTGIPDTTALKTVLQQAKKPLFFVGAEDLSLKTHHILTEISEQYNIPVLTSYRAKGIVPESSKCSIGCCGLSPVVDRLQQDFIKEADLLICVGLDPVELRPNWLPGWPEELPVINISASGQPDLLCDFQHDIRGDIALSLQKIASLPYKTEWKAETIGNHKNSIASIFQGDQHNPATVFQTLQQHLPNDTVLCVDVGSHRITASHTWKCKEPRTMLQSNGFSSMGVGIPYGIACAMDNSNNPVLVVTGDMGLGMALGELGLIQERQLDIIIVYLADRSLSLIELKQERDQYANFGVRFSNPDPIALASAFGGKGWRCADSDALDTLLQKEDISQGFHLIEVAIDSSQYREQM